MTLVTWVIVASAGFLGFLLGKVLSRARARGRQLDVMTAAALDIVCVAGVDGFVRKVNPYALELLGYTEKELLTRPYAEFAHPDDLARLGDMVARIAEGKPIVDFTIRVRAADGGYRLIEWRLAGLGEGLFSGVGRDITDRSKSADEVRQLSQVLAQSPVAIVFTDLAGRIEFVNPAFTEATGFTAAEAIGNTPRILKSGMTPPEVYEELWETILAGRVWRGELHNRKRDGSLFWERAMIAPLRDASGIVKGFVAFKEDITRQKQLEAEYLQAQKMESIGRLAGGIAHDFNNLLTSINGYAHLVLEALPQDSPAREDVHEIEAAGRRAAGLTQHLLAFSRKQQLHMEILDLNALTREAAGLLRRILRESIVLVCDAAGPPCFARLDASQFTQVIMNLAVNARDAMPDGGTLRLAIERRATGKIVLTVSDTGTGLSDEARAHLFEPFFTTKPKGVGTGLGLSTVYGIVTQCGGEISVESAPGKGTTFRVAFPESKPVAAERAGEAAPPAPTRRRILLVDDEKGVRQLAERVLAAKGYSVITADGGAAALQALREQGAVDLLVTDVIMPGMSGPELAQEFKKKCPSAATLFMSGYIDDNDVIERLGSEEAPFLRKPFTPPVLAKAVALALNARKR